LFRKHKFWERKQNPADAAAKQLANLLGTSVSGFVPDPPNDHPDLEKELLRSNVVMARLVIISGLVNGDKGLKAKIITGIQINHFPEGSFERYLYGIALGQFKNNGEVSVQAVEKLIPDFGPLVNGEPLNKRSLLGCNYKWSQILQIKPTENQIERAIDLILSRQP